MEQSAACRPLFRGKFGPVSARKPFANINRTRERLGRERLAGDAGVENLGIEVGPIGPFNAAELRVDADLGKERRIAQRREDAIQGQDFADVDLAGFAVVETQEEAEGGECGPL